LTVENIPTKYPVPWQSVIVFCTICLFADVKQYYTCQNKSVCIFVCLLIHQGYTLPKTILKATFPEKQ